MVTERLFIRRDLDEKSKGKNEHDVARRRGSRQRGACVYMRLFGYITPTVLLDSGGEEEDTIHHQETMMGGVGGSCCRPDLSCGSRAWEGALTGFGLRRL